MTSSPTRSAATSTCQGLTPRRRARIAGVAERLDAHRKAALARDERVTTTGMYNVVEKLRSGAQLTTKEQAVHTLAACGVLRDLHEELDALVSESYGWEWPQPRDIILERLVALHDERVREERAGKVRWLRPDYQVPRFMAFFLFVDESGFDRILIGQMERYFLGTATGRTRSQQVIPEPFFVHSDLTSLVQVADLIASGTGAVGRQGRRPSVPCVARDSRQPELRDLERRGDQGLAGLRRPTSVERQKAMERRRPKASERKL